MKTEITPSDKKSPSIHNLHQLRDAFLILWATYHGPRGKEIQTATWAPDDTGNFYKKNGIWHYQYKPVMYLHKERIPKITEYQLAYETAVAIESLTLSLKTGKPQLKSVKIFPNYPEKKPDNFSHGKFRQILKTRVLIT